MYVCTCAFDLVKRSSNAKATGKGTCVVHGTLQDLGKKLAHSLGTMCHI